MTSDRPDDRPSQLKTLVDNTPPGEHPDIAQFSQDDLAWLETSDPEQLDQSLQSIRNDLLDRPIP